MSMIKALRTLAAMENGTLNAASLETLLAGSQARKDELRMLLATRSLFDRVAASKNTCDALAGSATAASIIAGNVPYQSEFITALLKTSPGKLLIHATDTFLSAIAASSTLITAARAANGYAVSVIAANGTTPANISLSGTAYILLGSGVNATAQMVTISTKRSGSTAVNAFAPVVAANATSNSQAVPLVPPYSFVLAGAGTSTHYFGLLRCDI